MYEEANKNQSIMPIDLLIGGDHIKREFREIIKPNVKFAEGRYITIILRLIHVQFKTDDG